MLTALLRFTKLDVPTINQTNMDKREARYKSCTYLVSQRCHS